MITASVPYQQVPHSSALLLDYLYHFDRVSRFSITRPPTRLPVTKVWLPNCSASSGSGRLCAILTRQNQAFGCGAATLENLERLAKSGTFAVVTGQQVGLFSGPAFTLFKALTTVRLANYLATY